MAEASASADVPMEDAAAAAVPPPVSFNIIGRGGNELTSGCFYRLMLIHQRMSVVQFFFLYTHFIILSFSSYSNLCCFHVINHFEPHNTR